MKADIVGDFGSATIDLPDNAKNDPEKLKSYLDNFEAHAQDIKAGKMPLPDFDSFQNSVGHGMGDLKTAESEPTSPKQSFLDSPLMQKAIHSPVGKGLIGTAKFIGDLGQVVPDALINAPAQAFQDKGPTLAGAGELIGNEAKALATPFHTFQNPIQSTGTSFARAGIPNAPQSPPILYPGAINPGGNDAKIPGLADQLGFVANNILPAVATGPILKGIGSAAEGIAGAASKAGQAVQKSATTSILSKLGYDPELYPSVPEVVGEGVVKNQPMSVAQKLKQSDLLYNPEKAKINLENGLDKWGKAISNLVDKGTEADVKVPVQDVLDNYANLKTTLLNQKGEGSFSADELNNNILPKIQKAVDNLKPDANGLVDLNKSVEFRRDLQDMVNNWGDAPNRAQIQSVAKDLQGSMNDAIRASDRTYGPALANLNEKYSGFADAQSMIDKAFKNALQESATGASIDLPTSRRGVLNKLKTPLKTAFDLLPDKVSESVANMGARPIEAPPSLPISDPSTPQSLASIKQPFVNNAVQPNEGGLLPRQPLNVRRPLNEAIPVFVNRVGSVQDPEALPPRQPLGQRLPLGFAGSEDMDPKALGQLMMEQESKVSPQTQFAMDRIRKLTDMAQKETNPKIKAALANLIVAIHKAQP